MLLGECGRCHGQLFDEGADIVCLACGAREFGERTASPKERHAQPARLSQGPKPDRKALWRAARALYMRAYRRRRKGQEGE